jgi:oligoendopeptidase F
MSVRGTGADSGARALAPEDQGPEWSLADLYGSPEAPEIEADLTAAGAEAESLVATWKGRLAEADGDGLARLIAAYEVVEERLGRLTSYAQLLHAAHLDDDHVGRFYQSIQERVNAVGSRLLFVTLELNKLEEERLAALIEASPRLARWRPWLREVRAFRPHQLDDEIERVLYEKSVTGRSAWVRLFDETMAALRFPVEGRDLTSTEVFDLLSDKDRSRRAEAGGAIGRVLEGNIRLLARITNTLAKDKQIEDGWRRFPRPISARNLSNRVEDEVVDALIEAVRAAYPRLSHRYYALKAGWLGLDRLAFYDRNAPLPEDSDRRRPWREATAIVHDAYRSFSPRLADIVDRFYREGWIDARLRPGKDSGAFCHSTVPSVHPYVLMNYQGRNRDVMTLAHELGHGVHQVLAARQGQLMADTPLTLAETASVFGEQLTFQALLREESDPAARRVLLAAKIEDALNTVVRQIAFVLFERRLHDARRQAELTPDELAALWMEVQTESLGPAFEFDPVYRNFWGYIPHFVHAPFYVYAYAFGDCLVGSLYAVYEAEPEGFQERYHALLEAGGTLRHKELLAPFGLDASDPAFWARGLDLVAGMIDRLETELATAPPGTRR